MSQPPKAPWIALAAGGLLLAGAWLGLTWKLRGLFMEGGKSGLPAAGTPAPEFRLKNLKGEEAALSDFRGKVVVLNFWATWCGPCRSEIPAFNKFHEIKQKQGIEVLGVAMGQGAGEVGPFLAEHPIGYPVLLDETGTVSKLYGVSAIPTTFLLDREGVIRASRVGAIRDLDGQFSEWPSVLKPPAAGGAAP